MSVVTFATRGAVIDAAEELLPEGMKLRAEFPANRTDVEMLCVNVGEISVPAAYEVASKLLAFAQTQDSLADMVYVALDYDRYGTPDWAGGMLTPGMTCEDFANDLAW